MGTVIFLLGAVISFAGAILFLVAAFNVSLVWGILCLLGAPFANMLFLVLHWEDAWRPWCIQLVGLALVIVGVMKTPDISARDIFHASSDTVLPGNYDLTGTIKGYTPNPVHVGDAVTFTYVVENNGKDKVPQGSYMVKFYVNDRCVASDGLTMALPAGSGSTYSMGKGSNHFVAEKPGEYTCKLEITTRDGLVDANPDNNIITGKLLVRESGRH